MVTNPNANPFETGTDDLERFALEECVKRQRVDHRVGVLVVNDGRCALAGRFARLGARVSVAAPAAQRRDIEGRMLASGCAEQMTFIEANLAALPALAGDPGFDIVFVADGLSAVRYADARRIIGQLMRALRIGGKLYVSLLGLHSELGHGYADSELPVEARFAVLAPAVADKYDIRHPLCLYTERNLFMLLLEAHASVLRTLTTTYGNVKGVAVRV